MPNLHSHAFQRALAGRTGHPMPERAGGDTFWTWRNKMYAFIERVDADGFEAIAFAGVRRDAEGRGYTSVAEFHYVHHDPQGWPYSDPAELSAPDRQGGARCRHRAHAAAGVLCAFGFRGAAPTHGQRRFVQSVDVYARLVASLEVDATARGYKVRDRRAQPCAR
jgi:hypothetical protein